MLNWVGLAELSFICKTLAGEFVPIPTLPLDKIDIVSFVGNCAMVPKVLPVKNLILVVDPKIRSFVPVSQDIIPLRLLAREVYDKVIKKISLDKVALITWIDGWITAKRLVLADAG